MVIDYFHQPGDSVRANQAYVQSALEKNYGISDQAAYILSDLGHWDCIVQGRGVSTWQDRRLPAPQPDIYWIRLLPDFPNIPDDKAVTLFYDEKHVMENCFYRINK